MYQYTAMNFWYKITIDVKLKWGIVSFIVDTLNGDTSNPFAWSVELLENMYLILYRLTHYSSCSTIPLLYVYKIDECCCMNVSANDGDLTDIWKKCWKSIDRFVGR